MKKTYIAVAVSFACLTMNTAFAADGYYFSAYDSASNSYVDKEINISADEYFAKYPNGIHGVNNGINIKGNDRTKKENKIYTVGFSLLNTENLNITGISDTGIRLVMGQAQLGGESTKTINIESNKYGIHLSRLASLEASANNIVIRTENNSGLSQAVRVLESGSSSTPLNQSGERSGVDLSANQSIVLSSKASAYSSIALNVSLSGGFAHLKAKTIDLSAEVTSDKGTNAIGIDAASENEITLAANDISISANAQKDAYGIRNYSNAFAGATVMLGNQDSDSIVIKSQSKGTASGVASMTNPDSQQTHGGSIQLLAKTITVSATGVKAKKTNNLAAVGIQSWDEHTISVGDSQSSVSISASAEDSTVAGIAAVQGGKVVVNGSNLNIETTGGAVNSAIHAQNDGVVVINSKDTYLKGDTALTAFSQSRITVNGSLETNSTTAICARGNSLVSINESGDNVVRLTGDVDFNYDAATSGTTADATVNINLSNADSSWVGNSKTSVDSGTPAAELRTGKLNLTLGNGASWSPTKIDTSVKDSRAETLNSLTLNKGVINLTSDGASSVDVKNLSGNGTINTEVTKTDGAIKAAGNLNIQSGNAELNIVAQGITADDVANNDQLVALTGVVNPGEDASVTTITTVKEGTVKGEITQTTDAAGNTSTTQSSNSKLTAFNTVTAMATMVWRHDMNDLTKRMGELRDSPEGIGSWVRFYGSEQEYGRQNVTSKSTSVQLGSDYDIGSGWKVGGAFTYTDGTSKYDNGSSDNKAYGVAAYGSWLADNGAFVDLIGKYSRLSSDFELSSMDGKSKNNALSASVEAGWHIPFAELAFIEPQAELTYGVVLGDDFTTSNGVKISQEDTEALIGRLGVRTGFHFPNKKGTVYARASVLHDFKGESEFTASLVDDASVRSTMKDDIGGTYYEIGVGANFNWTDNAYSYVDLEKQNGGDVKENWRWNVGFRYVW